MAQKDVHYVDPTRESEPPEYDEAAAAEYVSNLQPIQDEKRKKKRNRIITVVVLAVLLIGGVAVYFLFFKKDPAPQQANQQTQQDTEVLEEAPVETKPYNSSDLGLSLDHPTTWTVDDGTAGMIRITSPVTKLTNAEGQEVNGKVVLTILSAGSEVPGFGDKGSLAAIDSEKITYAAPTQNQRKNTYLSFVSFSGGNSIDAVFVTGDFGYKKGQDIPEADIKKIEPQISLMFYSCDDTACQGDKAKSMSVASDSWNVNSTLKTAKTTIESLKIQ